MANIRKQFNFRNGVQVDEDNLVVSPTGLVGIGTTVPVESLDVRGNASVTGFATANALYSSILDTDTATIGDIVLEDSIIGSGVSIRSGVVTATTLDGNLLASGTPTPQPTPPGRQSPHTGSTASRRQGTRIQAWMGLQNAGKSQG